MADTNIPTIMSHISIGSNNFARAVAFYDAVLATIGAKRIMDHPGAVAYGKRYPEFWVQTPIDGEHSTCGNGSHIGFMATSREQVHAFYEAALAAGAVGAGEPGPRPMYSDAYYGCFVRDLDGHKIETSFWDAPM